MNGLSGEFVARLAAVWHRFTVPEADRATLAEMLAPMDAAGESVAAHLAFDMEPSDFETALADLAPQRPRT